MPASDNGPDGRKERYRRGVAFLQSGRKLPELSQSQIDRIERHLNPARPSARRPILSPALAALVIVLVGGAALAVAGRSLVRLPVIGALVDRWLTPSPARKGATDGRARRAGTAPIGAGAGVGAPGEVAAPAPAPTLAPTGAGTMARAPAAAARNATAAGAATTRVAAAPAFAAPDVGGAPSAPARPRRRPAAPTVALAAAVPADTAPAPAALPGTGRSPAAATPTTTPTTAAASPSAPSSAAAATTSPTPTPESPIVAESRSFSSALERWHRDHDAQAALTALDAHDRRFPKGEIRLEAQLLRAEILLAGGQDRDGLALLDPLALSGLPRARELRTVRGELRVKFGRCVEGKADLTAVLADGAGDALAQRARQALGDCP